MPITYRVIKEDTDATPPFVEYCDINDVPLDYNLDLRDQQVLDFPCFYDLIIDSVENVIGTPVITIKDDGVAYTLGQTILKGSVIEVTADVASAVILHISIPQA